MKPALRQYWDTEKDAPCRKNREADKIIAWSKANSVPIAKYTAKVVRLAHGQIEVSCTRVNEENVNNHRMGFNPLLDCPRKERADRTDEEQAERDLENRKRATKLARQNVRYLVKAAQFDHMLTFGYRDAVLDRDRVAANWKAFVRLYRKRYPDWQYLAVLERHDSEQTLEAHRNAYHIHVAVKGRQNIKWLLRCWLLTIGQPLKDVSEWLIEGIKLGFKSLGSVNVQAPMKLQQTQVREFSRSKIAGYLTKYIGKELDLAGKGKKKYWHSDGISKPEITRFWLKAKDWESAYRELLDMVIFSGVTSISTWGDNHIDVVWITGETALDRIGQCTTEAAPFDFFAD